MGVRTLATALLVFALVAASCSSSDGVDEAAGPQATQPITESADGGRMAVDEPGLQVEVGSASALDADGITTERIESAEGPDSNNDGIVIGDVYRIEAPAPLADALAIRMPVQDGVEAADQSIAYFDDALDAWVAVETRRADAWLSAETDHLSDWTVVDLVALAAWWTARLAGLRADPPTCAGAAPEWVTSVAVDTSPNAELLVCETSDEQGRLRLKVVNNRAVPTWLLLSHATAEPARTSNNADLATVVAQIAQALGRSESAEVGAAAQVVLIPGLGSTELTFDQDGLVGAATDDQSEAVLIGNSRRGLPVIAGYLALELLAILGGDSALAVTVGLYDCANQADQWDDLDWSQGAYPIIEYIRSYVECVGAAVATALAGVDDPRADSLDALRRLGTFLKWFEGAKLAAALADVSIDSLDGSGDNIRVTVDYCGSRPTLDVIGARTWQTDVLGPVTSVGGRYTGGGGFFELLPETFLVADLNGDCQQDIVVVSRENGGGSGTFYRLRVLVADRGRFDEVNVIPLGDRIIVESVRHDGGGVRLDLVVQAPGAGLAGPELETSPWLTYADLLQASTLPDVLTLPAEEPASEGITHAEIKATFAVEPNIHYVGACDGSVFFEGQRPSGATPFCGIIGASDGETADVTIIDDSGFETAVRFVKVDGAWTFGVN